jgi:quercetin dioxygenase-like cupin family protein
MQHIKTSADPIVRRLDEVAPEILYGFERKVMFSPSAGGSPTMKFAIVHGKPGAKSKPHTHPGGELAVTLKGAALLVANGIRYNLIANTAASVPPDVQHPAESVADEDWVVVTTYCDECPLMREKKARDRAAPALPAGAQPAAPIIRPLADIVAEQHNGFERQVLFSPSAGNSTYMTLSLVHGKPGAQGQGQPYPCGEMALTLQGHAVLTANGKRHELPPGSALSVPPGASYPTEAVGAEDWLVVTGSCSECPLMHEKIACESEAA